ncbi:MAG: pyridoxamine 5'-phosphate oxidase family protein [Scytonematopsis contorta HA4267-MV1]|jgi:PPOX class probable FMN-dependent enzyme|nr:pyridoxamine 5'-phosphate oxidase family protein [Scytonematopsis contorta HA4267-MV1]
MSVSLWRSPLSRALHRNRSKPHTRYFQLATVQADGNPTNRTVVFRGFLGETDKIKIITDSRSQKFQQVRQNTWGEICWYFTETREQFRLAGEIILVDVDNSDVELQKARHLTWQELSDNARIQFAWAHPGKERANQEAFSPPLPDAIVPLANFCLLLLDPLKVDHLELRGEPQNRWFYLRDESGNWEKSPVNP